MKRETITTEFLHVVLLNQEIDLQGKLADRISNHIDSLELIEVVIECEKHFAISISNEALEVLVTFEDLITVIENAKAIAI